MSELELLEAEGAWYSPLLAVLLIGGLLLIAWAVLHAPLLLAAHRRGLDRLRAAKHREDRGRIASAARPATTERHAR